jgi:hypothetical protein
MQLYITNSEIKPFNILSLNYNYRNSIHKDSRNESMKYIIPSVNSLKSSVKTPMHYLLVKTIKDYNISTEINARLNPKTVRTLILNDDLNEINALKGKSFSDNIIDDHIKELYEINLNMSILSNINRRIKYDTNFQQALKSYNPTQFELIQDNIKGKYLLQLNRLKNTIYSNENISDRINTYKNIYKMLERKINRFESIEEFIDIKDTETEFNIIDLSASYIDVNTKADLKFINEKYVSDMNITNHIINSVKKNISEKVGLDNLKSEKIKNELIDWYIRKIISEKYIEDITYLENDVNYVKSKILNNDQVIEFKLQLFKLYEEGKLNNSMDQQCKNKIGYINDMHRKYIEISNKVVLENSDGILGGVLDNILFNDGILKSIYFNMMKLLISTKLNTSILSYVNNVEASEIMDYILKGDPKGKDLEKTLSNKYMEELEEMYRFIFLTNLKNYLRELMSYRMKDKSYFAYDFRVILKQTSNYVLIDDFNFKFLYNEVGENVYTKSLELLRREIGLKIPENKKLLDFNREYNTNDKLRNWMNKKAEDMINVFNSTITLFNAIGKTNNLEAFLAYIYYDDFMSKLSYNIHSNFVPVGIIEIGNELGNFGNMDAKNSLKLYNLIWKHICNELASLMLSLNKNSIENNIDVLLGISNEFEQKSKNVLLEKNMDEIKRGISDNIKGMLRIRDTSKDNAIKAYIQSITNGKSLNKLNFMVNIRKQ